MKFKIHPKVLKNFTGFFKVLEDNSIWYYENGKVHNENGPGIIFLNTTPNWRCWYYQDKSYGFDDKFTNKTWSEFVRNLKFGIFK
jgi:hypothetical protein